MRHWVGAIVFAAASSGCIRAPDVAMANRSDGSIVATAGTEESKRCEVGAACRFSYSRRLRVTQEGREWLYDMPRWPTLRPTRPYVVPTGILSRSVEMELDGDGRIWMLVKESAGSKRPETQPEGFPVRPLLESGHHSQALAHELLSAHLAPVVEGSSIEDGCRAC